MREVRFAIAMLAALVTLSGFRVASAQDQKLPNHVHYKEPAQQGVSPTGAIAPRLQKLGDHKFPVSTKNAQAQLFMNQGLNLSYAFNHAEAGRAYREAERLDPNLAIAFWGEALALGPNINAPMDPTAEPKALEAIQKAIALKAKASPREQALIDALKFRYNGRAQDRRGNDVAYADAMRRVHLQFPDDDDISMLYVESVMDLRPWGYWTKDGTPYDRTPEIVGLTEKVIAKNQNHPGALHLYIHLMEAYQADKAEAAADRLLMLMPAAGHMVHMPAHTFFNVGRYKDALATNVAAISADDAYLKGSHWSAGVRASVPFSFFNLFSGRNPFEGAGEAFRPRQREFRERLSDMVIRSHDVKTVTGDQTNSSQSTKTSTHFLGTVPKPTPAPSIIRWMDS